MKPITRLFSTTRLKDVRVMLCLRITGFGGNTMMVRRARFVCGTALFACWVVGLAAGAERTERFDRDPGWDGRNNRATTPEKRTVRQDFGYSRTAHAGGKPGEIGGFISPAAEPAYYARKMNRRTFADPLSVSGTLRCKDRECHLLIGFLTPRQ